MHSIFKKKYAPKIPIPESKKLLTTSAYNADIDIYSDDTFHIFFKIKIETYNRHYSSLLTELGPLIINLSKSLKDKNILEPIYRSQYKSLEKAFREFTIGYKLFTKTYNFIYEYLHTKFESLKDTDFLDEYGLLKPLSSELTGFNDTIYNFFLKNEHINLLSANIYWINTNYNYNLS